MNIGDNNKHQANDKMGLRMTRRDDVIQIIPNNRFHKSNEARGICEVQGLSI